MAKSSKRKIEQYQHADKKRANNPPVGLVTPQTDQDAGKKTYAHDPHLDPSLQWAGKAEHISFDVPTVSLHVHERIDPRSILEAVRRPSGSGGPVRSPLVQPPDRRQEKTGMLFLKAQMNPDLLTDDLKKKRASNESFWLVGQPDVALRQISKGNDQGKWEVEVYGFDYYNPRKGTGVVSLPFELGENSRVGVKIIDDRGIESLRVIGVE